MRNLTIFDQWIQAKEKARNRELWFDIPQAWLGRTVYIIGGGPSLRGMDWEPLKCKNVIGINDAYKLGNWVDICFFGDDDWYNNHHRQALLNDFTGFVISCASRRIKDSQVLEIQRRPRGFWPKKHHILGWWGNSGACAIGLALKLGAARIVLLGYDLGAPEKDDGTLDGNWHDENIQTAIPAWYEKFLKEFDLLGEHVKKDYPDVEIINANPDSKLEIFPKIALEDII